MTPIRENSSAREPDGESGTAILEFAITFPLFMVFTLCLIQLALLINARQVLQYAAYRAARSAIVQNGASDLGSIDTLGSGTVHDAGRGDFVYFDPPYHPLSPTSSFTSYTGNPFGVADQEELASVVTDLHHRGTYVMLSNSDTPLIRRLYDAPGLSIRTVHARRSINSRGDRRGAVREVVILNYDPAGRAQAYA